MRAVPTAGEADIGLARLARTIDHAADNRDRQWRGDMGEALFEALDRLNHFELLPGARRAGNDGDPSAAQV
jgi:hypothetical protein